MFGKRNAPAPSRFSRTPEPPPGGPPTPPTGGPPHAGPSGERPMPWHADPSWTACNLATGNLANNLPSWLAQDGRVHAETYVAAAGAIAGYAAQQSLLARHRGALPPGIQTVTTRSGDSFLSGDALDRTLIGLTNAEADGRVFSRAAGGAVAAGLSITRLPDFERLLAHVAASLGGPLDGLPSTGPDRQPHLAVRPLLAALWPAVLRLFAADFDDQHRRFGPVPQHWWGAVAAFPMARPIVEVKDVLPPAVALTILMESAIYASKLTRL